MKKLLFICLTTLLFLKLGPAYAAISPTPVAGHSVLYSTSVDESFTWKLKLIENAQYSIEMSTGYAAGKSFDQVLALFEKKMQENPSLTIHLLITDVPIMSESQKTRIANLATTYYDRFFYRIDGFTPGIINKKLYTLENHMKFMVVDESYFLLGGSNLLDSDVNVTKEGLIGGALPKAYSDSDIVGKGPQAATLRNDFFQIYAMYDNDIDLTAATTEYRTPDSRFFTIPQEDRAFVLDFETSPKLVQDASIIARVSGPRYNYGAIGKALNLKILLATSSIDMGQLYFFPYDTLYNSIVIASGRGIKISLITNGAGPNAPGSTIMYAHASRNNYFPIMVGREYSTFDGIKAAKAQVLNPNIYEYNVKDVLYHNKVTVIDNNITFIGSYNYGIKSQVSDFEVSLEVHSPAFATQVKTKLIADRSLSRKVSKDEALNYYYSPLYKMADFTESIIFDGRVG